MKNNKKNIEINKELLNSASQTISEYEQYKGQNNNSKEIIADIYFIDCTEGDDAIDLRYVKSENERDFIVYKTLDGLGYGEIRARLLKIRSYTTNKEELKKGIKLPKDFIKNRSVFDNISYYEKDPSSKNSWGDFWKRIFCGVKYIDMIGGIKKTISEKPDKIVKNVTKLSVEESNKIVSEFKEISSKYTFYDISNGSFILYNSKDVDIDSIDVKRVDSKVVVDVKPITDKTDVTGKLLGIAYAQKENYTIRSYIDKNVLKKIIEKFNESCSDEAFYSDVNIYCLKDDEIVDPENCSIYILDGNHNFFASSESIESLDKKFFKQLEKEEVNDPMKSGKELNIKGYKKIIDIFSSKDYKKCEINKQYKKWIEKLKLPMEKLDDVEVGGKKSSHLCKLSALVFEKVDFSSKNRLQSILEIAESLEIDDLHISYFVNRLSNAGIVEFGELTAIKEKKKDEKIKKIKEYVYFVDCTENDKATDLRYVKSENKRDFIVYKTLKGLDYREMRARLLEIKSYESPENKFEKFNLLPEEEKEKVLKNIIRYEEENKDQNLWSKFLERTGIFPVNGAYYELSYEYILKTTVEELLEITSENNKN